MAKEYLTFVDSPDQLIEGQEVGLIIKDLTPGRLKYCARYVKAIVSHSADKLPDADILWLRSRVGNLYPSTCRIKITEEVGEYMPMASGG